MGRDSSYLDYLSHADEGLNTLLLVSWVQGVLLRLLWCGLALSLIGVGFFIGAWTSYLLDPNCSIPAHTAEEYIRLRNIHMGGTDMEPPSAIH